MGDLIPFPGPASPVPVEGACVRCQRPIAPGENYITAQGIGPTRFEHLGPCPGVATAVTAAVPAPAFTWITTSAGGDTWR